MLADKSYDVEFADAIRRTAGVLNASALRDAAESGKTAALLKYLRSERELGPGERELLAELLAGEIGRPKGRRGLPKSEKDFRVRVCAEVKDKIAEMRSAGLQGPWQEKAIKKVADRNGRSVDQVRLWLKD